MTIRNRLIMTTFVSVPRVFSLNNVVSSLECWESLHLRLSKCFQRCP